MGKWWHYTLYQASNYLSMLRLKLFHLLRHCWQRFLKHDFFSSGHCNNICTEIFMRQKIKVMLTPTVRLVTEVSTPLFAGHICVGDQSTLVVAIQNIPQKLILNTNLTKSFFVHNSFFIWHIILKFCTVQIFKMIWPEHWMLPRNELKHDLSLKWV